MDKCYELNGCDATLIDNINMDKIKKIYYILNTKGNYKLDEESMKLISIMGIKHEPFLYKFYETGNWDIIINVNKAEYMINQKECNEISKSYRQLSNTLFDNNKRFFRGFNDLAEAYKLGMATGLLKSITDSWVIKCDKIKLTYPDVNIIQSFINEIIYDSYYHSNTIQIKTYTVNAYTYNGTIYGICPNEVNDENKYILLKQIKMKKRLTKYNENDKFIILTKYMNTVNTKILDDEKIYYFNIKDDYCEY